MCYVNTSTDGMILTAGWSDYPSAAAAVNSLKSYYGDEYDEDIEIYNYINNTHSYNSGKT